MDSTQIQELSDKFEKLFNEMIAHQRKKLLSIAQEHYPRIGMDDLLNPHDFEKLDRDSRFNFEDGLLAGYIAAQMAVRAEFAQARHAAEEAEKLSP